MYECGLNINCIVASQFLQTTITFLVVADGEAPPIQDEVECSTCKRSFAPKVLVKSATSHSSHSHSSHQIRNSVAYFCSMEIESSAVACTVCSHV